MESEKLGKLEVYEENADEPDDNEGDTQEQVEVYDDEEKTE